MDVHYVKTKIVEKMINRRKWGASHTENILKGIPKSLKGSKITKKALKELIQSQWILPAKKTGEIHFSLNPEKTDEILKFYEEYCKK